MAPGAAVRVAEPVLWEGPGHTELACSDRPQAHGNPIGRVSGHTLRTTTIRMNDTLALLN